MMSRVIILRKRPVFAHALCLFDGKVSDARTWAYGSRAGHHFQVNETTKRLHSRQQDSNLFRDIRTAGLQMGRKVTSRAEVDGLDRIEREAEGREEQI